MSKKLWGSLTITRQFKRIYIAQNTKSGSMFKRGLIIALTLTAWTYAASAQDADAEITLDTSIIADNLEDTYARCLDAARMEPEVGMEMALRWTRLSGNEPSEHCQAIALMVLGDTAEAASRLEDLAGQSTATAPVRSGLYHQAARGWMDVASYDRALENLDKSAALSFANTAILLDRALVHAALQNYWSAVDDLNQALDIDPTAIDALVLRGSAYRKLKVSSLALDDIERALAADSSNVDALLELGLLARGRDNKTAARLAWVKVLALAPESSTADAVRLHIQNMDVAEDR